MHQRRRIINSIRRLLRGPETGAAAIAAVGKNVFANRPTVLWRPEMPAICIYAVKGQAENNNFPKLYRRTQMIAVEIVVEAREGADAIADDIAESVEAILLQEKYLKDRDHVYSTPYTENAEADPANTCDDFNLTGEEIKLNDEKTDLPIVSTVLFFEAEYTTEPVYDDGTGVFNTMRQTITPPGKDEPAVSDFVTDIHEGGVSG